MGTELIQVGQYAPPVSIASMRERQGFIQAFIREAMVEGVHFMVIPGTSEKSLTKQGSEFLLSAFQIAVEPKITETVGPDFVRVLVELKGTHMSTGAFVGVGVGRCSSNEEKYKWRRAVCREEYLDTPEDRRRVAYKNGKERGSFYKVEQVRAGHEDIANTVLKMAKKRAQADLCLTALAASDAFKTQKAPPRTGPTKEELQRHTRAYPETNAHKDAPEVHKPETKGPVPATNGAPGATDAPRPATSAQLGLLKRKLDQSGIPENHFMAQFEIGALEELPFARVDEALKWIADLMEPPQ